MDETQAEVASKKETAAKPKSKKMMMIIIGAVLLLLIAGGIGFEIISSEEADKEAAAKKSQAPKPQPALYFSVTPPFIINFQTLGRMRYMQIGVDIMTHDPQVVDIVRDNLPLIKNNLLALFDAQDFDVMTTTQGRQALREAALEEVQKVVTAKMGRPGVEAVLFTSFIIQ